MQRQEARPSYRFNKMRPDLIRQPGAKRIQVASSTSKREVAVSCADQLGWLPSVHSQHRPLKMSELQLSSMSNNPNALLEAGTRAAAELLGAEYSETAIQNALRVVGEAAKVHRVKIILQAPAAVGNAPFHQLVHEWWAPHLQSQASYGLSRFDDEDTREYLVPLQAGKSVWQLLDDVGPKFRNLFEKVGMKSMGVIPIFAAGAYAGMIAFDDCLQRRDFSAGQIQALTIVATALGAAIHRHELERQAVQRAESLKKANAALLRLNLALCGTADRLSAAKDPAAVTTEILRSVGTVLAPQGTGGVGLVRYFPAEGALRMTAYIVRGERVHIPELNRPFPVDSPTMVIPWKRVQTEDFIWGLTSDESALVPEARPFHEKLGAKAVAYIPLRHGQETTGFIGFNLLSDERPDAEQVDALRAISGHVALAAEVERLAEEARQTTIAREREAAARERVAELQKTNEAITGTLQKLASERDIGGTPEVVLLELARQTDAQACYWFEYCSDSNSLEATIRIEDGVVLDYAASDEPEWMKGPFSADITPAFRFLVDSGEFVRQSQAAQSNLLWPGVVEWHERHGRIESIAYVVRVGDQVLGLLGLAFRRYPEFTPSQERLIRALTNQLALALYIVRLSEQSRRDAIENEKEQAALQRAEQARRVSDFLVDVVENLSAGDDFRPALESVVGGLARALHAMHVFLFRYDRVQKTISLQVSCVEGRIRWGIAEKKCLFSHLHFQRISR